MKNDTSQHFYYNFSVIKYKNLFRLLDDKCHNRNACALLQKLCVFKNIVQCSYIIKDVGVSKQNPLYLQITVSACIRILVSVFRL